MQGYAFVEFVDKAEAEQAQLYLDGGQVRASMLTPGVVVAGCSNGTRFVLSSMQWLDFVFIFVYGLICKMSKYT